MLLRCVAGFGRKHERHRSVTSPLYDFPLISQEHFEGKIVSPSTPLRGVSHGD
jgi:hypothetical protein